MIKEVDVTVLKPKDTEGKGRKNWIGGSNKNQC
jgi:hypothetical protein